MVYVKDGIKPLICVCSCRNFRTESLQPLVKNFLKYTFRCVAQSDVLHEQTGLGLMLEHRLKS